MAGNDDTQRVQQQQQVEDELDAEGLERAEIIGRGGFGTVFRCFQAALGRTVAVKVLSSDFDTNSRARFLREQRTMAQLSGHPNVVAVLHADVTFSGRPYIVMPYHRRGSLTDHLQRRGPLHWPAAVALGVKLAGALESSHRLGILHRDVKPGNVLITDYGEPQLCDFGIARISGGFETSTGLILGSPAYTAPEILNGKPPSVASDLYGLGASLFCLVTGHAALERREGEEVVAHFVRVASTPVPDLGEGFPQGLTDAIQHAMAMSPNDRPATAAELGEQLRDLQRRHGHRVSDMALITADQNPLTDSRSTTFSELQRHVDGRSQRAAARPPSAATKFRPPLAAHTLVRRAKLIERIWDAGRKRLVVIHAPAGFGKSTLAMQWRERLLADDVPVAWLNIDRDDDNLIWFLEHLIEAIRLVRPNLAIELRQALEEHGHAAERYVLTSLINEIYQAQERFAVVLDDWHRVSNPGTIGALDFLLEQGCHYLQIVVTSRSRQGLPLSRMRVEDELVEIDSADLRFDVDESREFLVDLARLPLDTQDIVDLRASTDGWIAALQLASLSLRHHDDPTEFISHLSGRHRAIAEYLADNVLNTLDSSLLEFMLATSVSERICAELAATLSQRDQCQALLEQIEQRDLFLRALDDERTWFRYHHLFADFLRRRLERDHPGRLTGLHRVASQWFSERKMLSEAVDHALAAGDPDRAIDLVERDGIELVENSQMSTLLGLIAKLPTELVADRPRMQIALGWAHVLLHHPPEPIQKALETMKSKLSIMARSGTDVRDDLLEASLIQSIGDLFADRIDGLLETASQCLERPDTLRPFVVASAANVASFEALHRFEFASARRWIEWAMPYHQRARGSFAAMYGYLFAGMAAHEQLDLTAAESLVRRAQTLACQSSGKHSYPARLAGAVLGELLYEHGRIAEAEALLDSSHQLGSEGGVVDFMLITFGTGSRIKAARGQRDAAAERLDEGERIAGQLSLPRLAARIENERLRCDLLHQGPKLVPISTSPKTADGPADGIALVTQELVADSHIRTLLRGSPADIATACAEADARMNRVDAIDRPRAHLQARLLYGACLHAAGRDGDALEVAAPAVARCAELDLPQFLLDAGPQIAALIHMFIADKERNVSAWPHLRRSFLDDVLQIA
ncbi:protein kinase domain-containing protein [Nocardia sp. AB354]|uniref:protein kinase domain-containing protein n=1 Tax=Nocardia sp. AB354 TaxID=3413283 RepID=UPI003C20DD4A